jgi:hypothetical protein
MRFRFIVLIALAATVVAVSADSGTTRGRITFEDLASIEPLGTPVLSPAGTAGAALRIGSVRERTETRRQDLRVLHVSQG